MTEDVGAQIRIALDAYVNKLDPTVPTVWDPPDDQPSWARRWAVPLVVALAAAVLIGGVAAVRWHSLARTPAAADSVRRQLADIARFWADGNGDQGPVSAAAVMTTRSRAEEYLEPGNGAGESQPVWVVQVHGDFVCGACKTPPGVHLTGQLITVVVDADSYEEGGFSFGGVKPSLSDLGRTVALPVPAVSATVRSALAAVARKQIDADHESSVETPSAVWTTRALAATLFSGPQPTGDGWVWLVQVRTTFRCGSACVDGSSAVGEAGVTTMIVDQSFGTLAVELGDVPSDLSRFGTPVTLSP